jgi:hypothetical protein
VRFSYGFPPAHFVGLLPFGKQSFGTWQGGHTLWQDGSYWLLREGKGFQGYEKEIGELLLLRKLRYYPARL